MREMSQMGCGLGGNSPKGAEGGVTEKRVTRGFFFLGPSQRAEEKVLRRGGGHQREDGRGFEAES